MCADSLRGEIQLKRLFALSDTNRRVAQSSIVVSVHSGGVGTNLSEQQPVATSFQVTSNTPELLKVIASELARIEECCRYSQQGQFEQSKFWHNTNL